MCVCVYKPLSEGHMQAMVCRCSTPRVNMTCPGTWHEHGQHKISPKWDMKCRCLPRANKPANYKQGANSMANPYGGLPGVDLGSAGCIDHTRKASRRVEPYCGRHNSQGTPRATVYMHRCPHTKLQGRPSVCHEMCILFKDGQRPRDQCTRPAAAVAHSISPSYSATLRAPRLPRG